MSPEANQHRKAPAWPVRWLFATVAGLVLPSQLVAHPELLEAIAAATARIDANPSASLYLQRSDLRRQHAEYDLALADTERAARLAPDSPDVDLARGRLMTDAGWFESAEVYLQRAISNRPESVEAHALLAEICERRNQFLRAAAEYAKAAQSDTARLPDYILARARVLSAAGDQYLPLALQALDQGMKRLGSPLVALQSAAIDLELRRHNHDAALARLDTLIRQSPHNQQWLAQRGDILRHAGRRDEARAAYRAAMDVIGRLPPGRQQTELVTSTKKRIQAGLDELERPTAQSQPAQANR